MSVFQIENGFRQPGLGPVVMWMVLGAAAASGCGSGTEAPPKLVSVTGKVLVNKSPLQGVALNFVPRDSTKGTGGFGGTLADGTYELMHRSRSKGIEPGTYYVTFSRFAMPDGSPIPDGKNVTDVGAVESFPSELVNPQPDLARHVVTVREGESQNLDFELTVKPKRK